MPETETIATEYGEVEAETEMCSNCEEKVLAEQTIDVVMGQRIKSWGSGTSGGSKYPAHRGVVGLNDNRNPESQIWCLDCAEYKLGYAEPAGTPDHRVFPNRFEKTRSVVGNPLFGTLMASLAIILLAIILL